MAFLIYLLGVVDKVIHSCIPFIVVGGVATLASSIAFLMCTSDENEKGVKIATRVFKSALKVFIVSLALNVLLPSSKTLAAMYLIPAIAQNEQIQNITGNSLHALESLTKQWAEDLGGELLEKESTSGEDPENGAEPR